MLTDRSITWSCHSACFACLLSRSTRFVSIAHDCSTPRSLSMISQATVYEFSRTASQDVYDVSSNAGSRQSDPSKLFAHGLSNLEMVLGPSWTGNCPPALANSYPIRDRNPRRPTQQKSKRNRILMKRCSCSSAISFRSFAAHSKLCPGSSPVFVPLSFWHGLDFHRTVNHTSRLVPWRPRVGRGRTATNPSKLSDSIAVGSNEEATVIIMRRENSQGGSLWVFFFASGSNSG